ncbi:MAG: hypothetical protein K2X03_08260 [Bryobacteraceae bacterium]|nr:hypothetical protein [Bryobacteraceae bacterium]
MASAIGAPIWVRDGQGDRPPGKIGAFTTSADGLWLVSANHVLAANGAYLDTLTGVYTTSGLVSRTVIFAELKPRGNRGDAAACRVAAPPGFRPTWPPGWRPFHEPLCPPRRTPVKIHAGGQDRFAIVVQRGSFRVDLQQAGLPGNLGEVEFADSLLVRTQDPLFLRPGNSGALVVTAGLRCRPVGLITGTSIEHGSDTVVISLLTHVLAALRLPPQILV